MSGGFVLEEFDDHVAVVGGDNGYFLAALLVHRKSLPWRSPYVCLTYEPVRHLFAMATLDEHA
ncbi:MAG TPA: hypothetical protein VK934_05720, partial [Fimbriimonas sp.]|nr:hypothetical protein [Fimbriimonas sp.]